MRKLEESKKAQTDAFQKVTATKTKPAPKRNALFDDEDDGEDIFKPKSKKALPNLPPIPTIVNEVKIVPPPPPKPV